MKRWAQPYKALKLKGPYILRPFNIRAKALIRPFKGLIRPFKGPLPPPQKKPDPKLPTGAVMLSLPAALADGDVMLLMKSMG